MTLKLAVLELCWVALALPAERVYDVLGQLIPEIQGSVSLHGAATPFAASSLTSDHGAFRFARLAAGQYTVAAFVPGYGEKRITIDVGPSTADPRGRFEFKMRLDDAALPQAHATVSAADLAIPDRARKQYVEANKRLGKHDVKGAVEHLERAVELAPGFTAAWNHLGTIAYQTRRYADAERYFRKALTTDPAAYEPLVNLGGVLLTLDKIDEAYQYNLYAALKHPADALANSQLGMNYFGLGKMELAEKYLLEARRLDPAHFSHPQLLAAEIYLRREEYGKAADQLDDFLHHHPDWPEAVRMRETIVKLRRR